LFKVAAGPLFSFLGAIGAAKLSTIVHYPELRLFFEGIAYLSIPVGFVSLVPFARYGLKTDGYLLFELITGRKGIRRLLAINSLLSSSDEFHPREWDAGLVELALDESVKINRPFAVDPLLLYIRYQRFADTGAVDPARDALAEILRQPLSKAERFIWQWEAVWFEAFSAGNVEAAREMELRSEQQAPVATGAQVWKAKAAIAARQGRMKEAREAANKALSCCQGEPGYTAALIRALREDLDELLAGPTPLHPLS
jgi:hypothetical protein